MLTSILLCTVKCFTLGFTRYRPEPTPLAHNLIHERLRDQVKPSKARVILVRDHQGPELMLSSFELTSAQGVHAYLSSTPFATEDPGRIVALSGGTANFTYRLHLRNPYEGHATVILKHAQPYVRLSPTILLSIERQLYEVEALTRIHANLPADSFVIVPKVHLFDNKEHVVIMEDCGERNTTLKDYIKEGRLTSIEVTEKVARLLAQFIAHIHKWGRDPTVCGFFDGNQQGEAISSWATYGRVVKTLTSGQQSLPALKDNPISISEDDLAIIRRLADQTTKAMMSANRQFVMGDFWSGNVVLSLDEFDQIKRIYVVDWEMAKPGLLGVELGQFCAELDLLQRFHPDTTTVMSTLLNTFMITYQEKASGDIELARETLIHWAVHLIVWTPVVPWGSEERTREVVSAGLRQLLEGARAGREELQNSLVHHLLETGG